MHEPFTDDRLNKDMTEIRHIMDKTGTNPKFELEFVRNSSNNIVLQIKSTTTTMPVNKKQISNLDQIGEFLSDYIKDSANWV